MVSSISLHRYWDLFQLKNFELVSICSSDESFSYDFHLSFLEVECHFFLRGGSPPKYISLWKCSLRELSYSYAEIQDDVQLKVV